MSFLTGGYLNCTHGSDRGACPPCFCPNDRVEYTCKLTRLESTTRWTLPLNQCTASERGQILLSQAVGCGGMVASCGVFRATNVAVNSTTLPCSMSQLEVAISDRMDNTRVICSSINLYGIALEEYESLPITVISKCLL